MCEHSTAFDNQGITEKNGLVCQKYMAEADLIIDAKRMFEENKGYRCPSHHVDMESLANILHTIYVNVGFNKPRQVVVQDLRVALSDMEFEKPSGTHREEYESSLSRNGFIRLISEWRYSPLVYWRETQVSSQHEVAQVRQLVKPTPSQIPADGLPNVSPRSNRHRHSRRDADGGKFSQGKDTTTELCVLNI